MASVWAPKGNVTKRWTAVAGTMNVVEIKSIGVVDAERS